MILYFDHNRGGEEVGDFQLSLRTFYVTDRSLLHNSNWLVMKLPNLP